MSLLGREACSAKASTLPESHLHCTISELDTIFNPGHRRYCIDRVLFYKARLITSCGFLAVGGKGSCEESECCVDCNLVASYMGSVRFHVQVTTAGEGLVKRNAEDDDKASCEETWEVEDGGEDEEQEAHEF